MRVEDTDSTRLHHHPCIQLWVVSRLHDKDPASCSCRRLAALRGASRLTALRGASRLTALRGASRLTALRGASRLAALRGASRLFSLM